MKIYNEWMSDNEYFGEDYPNNKLLDDAKHRFELQKQSLEGKDALVDGISERIVAQNHTNPLNQVKYDKKLSFDITSNVHTGSLIEFDDKKWLVTSQVFDKQAYKLASANKTNNTLKLYNQNGILSEVPYVVFDSVSLTRMGTNDSKYLSIPNSKMMIETSDNEIARLIKRNDIFTLYNKDNVKDNYEVIDINRVRSPGLIILELQYSEEEQILPTYTLSILNGSSIQVNQTDSLTIVTQVIENDEIVVNPSLIYTSSNPLIATVSNAGVVTILDVGTVNITCSLSFDNMVSDTISVEIVEVPIENCTYNIVGESTVYLGYTGTYTAQKFNNGILLNDSEFDFTIINGSVPTSAYAISIIDSTTCTIKANSSTHTITIRATDRNDNTKYFDKIIKLESLF